MPSESSHEGEVARQGEEQKGESWFQGETKSTLDGGKHPSKCKWFNLSIFAKIYACFDCVVINHQKGGDCKEHGPIRPLFVILVIV